MATIHQRYADGRTAG